MKIISKEDFSAFVNALIEDSSWKVEGVKSKGNKFVFGELESADELRLDYDVTILPPKKFFFPQWETLMSYDLTDGFMLKEVNRVEPTIIIGIHPYDIVAIQQLDAVFKDANPDQNYLKKRDEALIIGVNIVNVSPFAFAGSMGSATVDDGFDLMLTDIGNGYAIEVGTSKGEKLLSKFANASDADSDVDVKVEEIKKNINSRFQKRLDFPLEEVPGLLERNLNNEAFWDEHSEKCLSCGSCVTTCPTCYCFDVQDKPDLSLKKGERIRTWDGCMLEDFAKVATGENFRDTKSKRYRHRYLKKGKYLYDRFGFIACVGCGRCVSQCLPDIADPTKVFNHMKEVT